MFAACILLTACGSSTETFSSAISPNGVWIAENVMTDNGPGDGYVTLARTDGSSRTTKVLLFGEPNADAFLKWIDDTHLEILYPLPAGAKNPFRLKPAVDHVDNVTVDYKAIEPPSEGRGAYTRRSAKDTVFEVAPTDVETTFSEPQTRNQRTCLLALRVKPGTARPAASVTIRAGINQCRDGLCGGLSTRFALESDPALLKGTILTSATVSDIPSYNRLAEGSKGLGIRGQFLGTYANALTDAIGTGHLTLEYSLDFFDRLLIYDVPVDPNGRAIESFKSCVGTAQFR